MIFRQIDEIVRGVKTQTRRIVKPEETDQLFALPDYETGTCRIHSVFSATNRITGYGDKKRLKWQVGRDYAVSPGRGKPGVWWNTLLDGTREWQQHKPEGFNKWQPLRIIITDIRREPLQDISEEDARAEGCQHLDCYYCGGQGWVAGTDMAHNPEDPMGNPIPVQVQIECSTCGGGGVLGAARDAYQKLWEDINGQDSWDLNPDVWVLTFKVKE